MKKKSKRTKIDVFKDFENQMVRKCAKGEVKLSMAVDILAQKAQEMLVSNHFVVPSFLDRVKTQEKKYKKVNDKEIIAKIKEVSFEKEVRYLVSIIGKRKAADILNLPLEKIDEIVSETELDNLEILPYSYDENDYGNIGAWKELKEKNKFIFENIINASETTNK